MSEVTRGPWQVVERKIPFSFVSPNSGQRTGEHVERSIYTAWDHPQLKWPYPVVTTSTGVGEGDGKAVQFTHISIDNANLIAAAPDLYAALVHALIWVDEFMDKFDCDPDDDSLDVSIHRAEIVWALAKARGETP